MELASREWLRMQQGHSNSVGIFKNFQNRAKFGEMLNWARGFTVKKVIIFQWMRCITILISLYNPQNTAYSTLLV